jgi:hypothetical protein
MVIHAFFIELLDLTHTLTKEYKEVVKMELITTTLLVNKICIILQYLSFFLNLPTKNSSTSLVFRLNPKGVASNFDIFPSSTHF